MRSFTQKSALPEERPDEVIIEQKKRKDILKRLRGLISREGAYNFCKHVVETRSHGDEYIQKHYNISGGVFYGLASQVFTDYTGQPCDIEQFLDNTKSVSNYSLQKIKKR